MWLSDRQHKGLFMPYFQKQVINYKFLSLIDREFPEKRKGHSWWKTPWSVKKSKRQQICSEKSSTQGSRELTEYSQGFHTVFSKRHFNILCPVAGFCGLNNNIPDGRFITLSTGRLLLAPLAECGVRLYLLQKSEPNMVNCACRLQSHGTFYKLCKLFTSPQCII